MNNYNSLLIGATFPTAEELRHHKSNSQMRFEELKGETTVFIKEKLRPIIINAQEIGTQRTWFIYPDFLKDDQECEQFLGLLRATLSPLGYIVSVGLIEEVDVIIVSWED